jgi:hypothetical protein
MVIGIVENARGTFGTIRDEAWRRYFFHVDDCEDGILPAQYSRVEFTRGTIDDGRGPRASRVVVLAEPAAAIHRACNWCRTPFDIDAGAQAWFVARGLDLPAKCARCRALRAAAGRHVTEVQL